MRIALQTGGDSCKFVVPLRRLIGRSADDQRSTRFVDQDRVDLIDHRKVVTALNALVLGPGHVVAQIVEAKFVVGPVSDIAQIGVAPFFGCHGSDDHSDGEAKKAMDTTHPFAVTLSQVIIDGHDVHAFTSQGVQISRQGANQSLSFTGAHFRNISHVERGPAHQLDVVVTLPKSPFGRLANRGECLGKEVIEIFPGS
ncbi:hypothetical protein GALL_477860 [mine drainage metagenome]|uniref:Uncharacterized protein n=1 Tax=mine drainage metagenome TaxID=410659 RepID=A0A1J5PS84_9ZZZZ